MIVQEDIKISDGSFTVKSRDFILEVREWGKDTVRIVCSPNHAPFYKPKNGIEELNKNINSEVSINENEDTIKLINNDLTVIYDGNKLTFYNKDEKILEEFSRKQSNVRRTIGIDDHIPIEELPSSSLDISPREFSYQSENSYKTVLRFEGDEEEKLFGLGGYQEKNLNKNFGTYELMQRNSQTSIPFYISNKNYGFIWNNSSIGEVSFSRNQKKWTSENSHCIDYLVTIGESPKQLLENLSEMTGRSPDIDNRLLGLWQSKLRYQTLSELKEIYNEYKKRNIHLSTLVIDYFHWTADGDFEFDNRYWDGISQFAKDLKETNTELMVSLWPTVTSDSKYYDYYRNNQMLIRSVHNKDQMFDGKEILDFSNPLTVKHFQKVLSNNYRENGIYLFWADQAEPEMGHYNHKEYLVYDGSLEKLANKYPYHYIKAIKQDEKSKSLPTLIRSTWFNSQKYGALAWSGDIDSSFDSFKRQIQIGISMGISGIPWWTSDIAGFHSGDSESSAFKELMIRWFQFAVFSPILRMHGDRQPHTQRIGPDGGGVRTSGGPNEIWSFGEEVETILSRFIKIREQLKEYISDLYKESSEKGYPLIRSMFFEFPHDSKSWEDTTQYMFGSDLLIAPVVEEGIEEMEVFLPQGQIWREVFTGKKYTGGKSYTIPVTIETIPVFSKQGTTIDKNIKNIFN